ncbi:MAG TPA: helix-turn-helix transcriptional regulator [Candidatus Saccharimonadales bacterium]|nr:helix-turn-helix transcriptional regulator [Candidatus Saccharimonadales bacterium]
MTKRIDTIYKEIGKRISSARTKRGWTQEKLAAESEVASAHIGFIEQGRRRPTVSTLHKLAMALNTTLEDLFKGL